MPKEPSTSDPTGSNSSDAGQARIEWADSQMPVLAEVRERFARERPLEGIGVAACLHVTAETANLVRALIAGAAKVALCAANPLSTQDDVALALTERHGATVLAARGEGTAQYAQNVQTLVASSPRVTIDDGADLVSAIHESNPGHAAAMLGGTEETTAGLLRVRALAEQGTLACPILAVNESRTERGDVFVTVTGGRDVLRGEHFERMKDGAVLANAGHFDVEIKLEDLRALAAGGRREALPLVEEHTLADGRRLNLLAQGRVVNLAAGEGHPASVMDMSFAGQALCVEYLVANAGRLRAGVLPVPEEIDDEVARLKLASLGVRIDELSEDQRVYRSAWDWSSHSPA